MAQKSPKIYIVLKVLLVIPVLILSFIILVFLGYTISNRTNGSIISSGETRRYLLHVPDSYDATVPTPLVVSIHGFASWPVNQAQTSQWNELSDLEGFIVAYPSGQKYPKRWRSSLVGEPSNELDNDLVFILDLIESLQRKYNVDPARIYVNGLSNGGGMSFLVGCELSDKVAAIGSVAGAYTQPLERCQPGRPVPMIAFHGTSDNIVPYSGGPSHSFEYPFPNIPRWIALRAEVNDCNPNPEEILISDEVYGLRYTACSQGADVVFYTINGGGHTWPGGKPLPEIITGYTSRAISATELMWEFFEQHPLTP